MMEDFFTKPIHGAEFRKMREVLTLELTPGDLCNIYLYKS